jgi:hypothetical protein
VRTCSTTVRTSRSVRRKSRLPTNTSPLVDPAPAANKPHLRIPCIRCPRSGAAAGGVTRLRTLFGAQEYSAYRHENLDSNDRIPRCFRSIAHLPDRRRHVPTALPQAYQQTRSTTSGCLAVNTEKDDQMLGTRRTRRGGSFRVRPRWSQARPSSQESEAGLLSFFCSGEAKQAREREATP